MAPLIVPTLPADIAITVERILAEDIGSGDITAQLIPPDTLANATLITREQAIFCGIDWANEVFNQLDPTIVIQWQVKDGDEIEPLQELAFIKGHARSILTAERSMLNLLQTLSATATESNKLAKRVADTTVRILDTRKTLPGLRSAQKYAVAIGGCYNHRMGLYDGFLIKENHIRACGSIAMAVSTARALAPGKLVEVEVESLAQLSQALAAKADVIMLDNFSLDDMHRAVALNNGQSKLEASGGIDKEALATIAATGVDFISVGALTKNCKAVDLSLLFS